MEQEIPEQDVLADNLPTFVGQGVGEKIRAKKAKRQAAAATKKTGQEGGSDGNHQ
jgi:hypothetical protein